MLSLYMCVLVTCVVFFKQKTAYEMRISDWSSDVCSSDLRHGLGADCHRRRADDGHHAGRLADPIGWRGADDHDLERDIDDPQADRLDDEQRHDERDIVVPQEQRTETDDDHQEPDITDQPRPMPPDHPCDEGIPGRGAE